MAEGTTRRRRRSSKSGSASKRVRSSASAKSDDKSGKTDDIHSHVPAGLAGAFVESKLHEKKLREAGLEPPADFEGDMPELPEDIDAVDHSELSNLMLRFQNALATSTWQAAMAYIANDIYEEITEYLENRSILHSDQSNDAKRRA